MYRSDLSPKDKSGAIVAAAAVNAALLLAFLHMSGRIDLAEPQSALQVFDLEHVINRGDSGGAVYFDGELIGVLWSIGEYDFGPGVNVSLLQAP